jgi:hypothetical protein
MLIAPILIIVFCGSVAVPQPGPLASRKSVPVLVSWNGSIKLEQRKKGPAAGYIADQTAWKDLWSDWRPTEEVPNINFSEVIVVVAVNRDPNKISAHALLDPQGDLTVSHLSTLIGYTKFDSCTYQFVLIRRDGIKTVNGKPIQAK